MAAADVSTLLGTSAPEFKLPATDGKIYALEDVAGPRGTVIVFMCNHCPYVKAVVDRLVHEARALMAEGIGFAAICSNDAESYPEDSLDNMKLFAKKHDFTFPYVIDETQDVARNYGAVCTPDFFGFNRSYRLAYRGRLDASGRSSDPNAKRELFDAMVSIARSGKAPEVQHPSVGCSIKWRG